MSLPPNTFRYPFNIAGQPAEVQQAHVFAYNAVLDLQNAIRALNTKVNGASKSTSTSTSTLVSQTIVTTAFPGLGGINDQTGATAYTVTSSDNGIFLILGDASPVTVTLNSALMPPYFLFVSNFGSASATLTPTSGTINQGTIPVGGLYFIAFNGTNWKASALITIPNFADDETPSGTIDGINTTFTLAHSPSPAGSLELFLNGLVQNRGVDYTLSTNTITFAAAPVTGSTLLSWYRF